MGHFVSTAMELVLQAFWANMKAWYLFSPYFRYKEASSPGDTNVTATPYLFHEERLGYCNIDVSVMVSLAACIFMCMSTPH